jgi:L-fucose mutarotase
MLKNTDPLLSPDLLYILAAMGHGDEIAIVDANFPAESMGERTVRLDGVNATQALDAVLTVLPLDEFVERPAVVMRVVGDAEEEPETVCEFKASAAAAEGRPVEFESLERFAFYDRTREAFAVLATGERRLYGNVILVKGIVRPD